MDTTLQGIVLFYCVITTLRLIRRLFWLLYLVPSLLKYITKKQQLMRGSNFQAISVNQTEQASITIKSSEALTKRLKNKCFVDSLALIIVLTGILFLSLLTEHLNMEVQMSVSYLSQDRKRS